MRNSRKAYLLFFVLCLHLSSCASDPGPVTLGQESDIILSPAEYNETATRAAALWAKRFRADDLLNFTHVNEKIVRSLHSTQNDEILQARAYYLLGEYFSNEKYQTQNNWVKASNWALQALARNPEFKRKLSADPLHPESALDVLTATDAEPLYWLAASLAKFASEDELKTRIRKMMDRVAVLKPTVNFGAVNRYYGVYYSSLADATPTDLKVSRDQFEKAIKRFPEFFENHVSFARFYAKKVGDQALLKQQVQWVLGTDAKHLKDFYPEQVLEKARAKILGSEGHYESH